MSTFPALVTTPPTTTSSTAPPTTTITPITTVTISTTKFGAVSPPSSQHAIDGTECNQILDIGFIVDNSGTINQTNWDITKGFMTDLLEGLHVGESYTHVGMVKYSTRARVEFNFDTYETLVDVQRGIDSAEYLGGNTNTSGGLLTAKSQLFNTRYGDRERIPNIAILLTDGISNIHDYKTLTSAAALRNHGVRVFVVGITVHANFEEIKGIATASNGVEVREGVDYFLAPDYWALELIKQSLINEACNEGGKSGNVICLTM